MKFFYLSGFFIALGVGALRFGSQLTATFSRSRTEEGKSGLYYCAWTGTYETAPASASEWVSAVVIDLGVAPLLSWITVITALGAFVHSRFRIPQEDAKIDSRPNVARIERGWSTVIYSGGEWYSRMELFPERYRFTTRSYPFDFSVDFFSEREYRLEGGSLLSRAIEDYTECGGKRVYQIKDRVVLESEIRERHATSGAVFSHSADDEVACYRGAVQWQEVKNLKMRYFIFSKHPDIVPREKFRKMVSADLRRLEDGWSLLLAEARRRGVEVRESGGQIDCAALASRLDEATIAKFGLTKDELYSLEQTRKDLMGFIGEADYVARPAV